MKKMGISVFGVAVILLLAIGVFAFVASSDFEFSPRSEVNKNALYQDNLRGQSSYLLNKFYKYNFETAKKSETNELISAAEKRKKIMLDFIEKNPKEVLKYSLPSSLLAGLPSDIREDYFEEQVYISGELIVRISDDFDGSISEEAHYLIVEDGMKMQIIYPDEFTMPSLISGAQVNIKGVRLDDYLVISSIEEGGSESWLSPPFFNFDTSDSDIEIKNVAVILYNFQDDLSEPYTTEFAYETILSGEDLIKNVKGISTNKYYREVSFNKLGLKGDVFGWFTIPFDVNSECNPGAWAEAAINESKAQEIDLGGYEYFIFSSNNNNCGNLYGVAEIGGRSAWIFWWNYSQSDYSAIVTHEFGHNLGARHAKSYACVDEGGEPVQISDDCVQSEYGDPFDIMGRTIDFRHMNNYHKSQINWFRDINTFDVDSNGEIYEMVPIELESTSVQSLRIPLGYTNLPTNYPVYYYLEYRKSFGFDDFNQEDPVVNGASIRFASEYSPPNPGHSFLIDTTPESSSDDFLDSALIRNNLFEDAFRGIKIETKGATDNLVRVNISFYQPECVHLNPRIRVDPPVQWGSPGDTLNYTVELINFDNHGCNSSDFLINWSYIDFGGTEIPEGWISLPEFPLTITLAPGEAQNIDVAITSADDAEFDFYEFLISMVNLDAPTYEHYWDFNYNVMLLTCGNEVIDPGEFCDGDSISCTAPLGYPGVRECNSICTEYGFCQSDLYCGDGEINGLEECDDGNNNNGDGCSWPECQEEFECGNGVCEIGETNETCPQDCGEAFGFLPSESYHLDADVRYDFADGRNETNIRNKVTGVVWDGRVIGDTLFIGSMVLDFVDMGWSSLYEWVLLGVNQSGSFNTIYDSGGFKVLLSEEDAFPSPTYNFQILGETNIGTEVIVEEFIFGWDFGDLELLGDTVYQDVNHSFNFSIVDNSYVRMNVDIEDGTANIPVLYGDGNQFLGMGRSASKQLAVSSNSTLLYIESEDFVDVHDAFVASWFGG